MEFRILGPIEASSGGQPLQLGGTRQRALLAYLLLHANQVVSAERLLDQLWPEPPAGGVAVIQTQVWRLRKPLGEKITTSGRGYQLHLEPGDELDLERFRELLTEAGTANDPAQRSALLREADALWRGEALAGVEAPFAASEAAALEELRLSALEDRLEADLDRGLNGGLVSELSALVAQHPLRERLRAQLILALYRAGRQADALDAYRQTRVMLDEQLGLAPSPALRELEQAILRQEPTLDRVPSGPDPAQLEQGSSTPSPKRRHRRASAVAVVIATTLAAVAVTAVTGGFSKSGTHAVFSDSLRGSEINTTFWDVEALGSGPTVQENGDGVFLTIPAHAAPTDSTGAMKARIASYCTLPGLFDVQVDYDLSTWPPGNGVGIGMYAAWADLIRESTPAREFYIGAHRFLDPPDGSPHKLVATRDLSGTLRIVRSANRMVELVREGGRWHEIYSFPNPTPAAVSVYLELWTSAQRFSHRQVQVKLTNFRVNSGVIQCPST